MNRALPLLTLAAAVALNTACDNKIAVEGLDVALADAEKPSAFFATDAVSYDTDLDGTDDVTVNWLNVVVTEDDDFCDRISRASDIGELQDVSALVMTVATRSELDFDDLSANTSLSDALTYSGTWAAARVLEREDDVTLVDATSDTATGERGSDQVMLSINGSSGESPNFLTISASYAADLSVDVDGDVDGRVEGAFFLAGWCQALVE